MVALPVTLVGIFLLGRYIDKRKFSDYGIQIGQKKWWADYGFGILAGFLAASSFVLILVLIGWAVIEPSRNWTPNAVPFVIAFLVPLLTFAGVGVFEELVRTYQIKNITEGLTGTRLRIVGAMLMAVFLAAMWSVLMHAASADWAFLVYILISALIYGLFYLWTRRAALAMGMHFAWDFSVSSIFVLGGVGAQEPAIFGVPYTEVSGFDADMFSLLGIIAKVLGLVVVAFWIKWRAGEIRLREEIAEPSLVDRKPHTPENRAPLKGLRLDGL